MWAERAKEMAALMMIGEGLVTVVEPERHCMLWKAGPRLWERMLDPFVDHPNMTRVLGAAQLALGFWLAVRQWETEETTRPMERVRERGREFARSARMAAREAVGAT
jgi:uncharacterized protein YjeT (DUF2065 family)